ncbi:zinc finger domain-containing protein [Mycolicibacterium brisbanense]
MAAARREQCPTCLAQPGQPCTGRRMRGPDACHTARIKAAKASKPPPSPWPVDEVGLRLVCQSCGEQITGQRPGYAAASHRAAYARSRSLQLWRREHPGEDVRQGPAPVPWRLVHEACDGDGSRDDFRIEARHLRTARQLLHLSVRLTGKAWVPNTDWAALVSHIMRASSEPQPETADLARRHAEAAKRAVPQEDRDD